MAVFAATLLFKFFGDPFESFQTQGSWGRETGTMDLLAALVIKEEAGVQDHTGLAVDPLDQFVIA